MNVTDSELVLHKDSECTFLINCAGQPIGKVELYCNSFHRENQYVRLHLSKYENAWASPLFSRLQQVVNKPLQLMLKSDDTTQVDFLLAGGFCCKRKCYEMEVSVSNFLYSNTAIPLDVTTRGQPEYAICCQRLYDYYKNTHSAINPLTADFDTFCKNLPLKAFYERSNGQIQHFSFVEENEIAYVGSIDTDNICSFNKAVVSRLFSEYETICFECDDCDVAAMSLKSLFCVDVQDSYDTYVRELL